MCLIFLHTDNADLNRFYSDSLPDLKGFKNLLGVSLSNF